MGIISRLMRLGRRETPDAFMDWIDGAPPSRFPGRQSTLPREIESRREIMEALIERQRMMDEPNPLFAAAGQEQPTGVTISELIAAGDDPVLLDALKNKMIRYAGTQRGPLLSIGGGGLGALLGRER